MGDWVEDVRQSVVAYDEQFTSIRDALTKLLKEVATSSMGADIIGHQYEPLQFVVTIGRLQRTLTGDEVTKLRAIKKYDDDGNSSIVGTKPLQDALREWIVRSYT